MMVLLVGAGMGLIAGCSTPCDGFGSPCAPVVSSSGTPPVPLPPRAPEPTPAPEPQSTVETFSVESPDAGPPAAGQRPGAAVSPVPAGAPAALPAVDGAGAGAIKIGLLLPLRSDTLGVAADMLRTGFMAAYERDRSGIAVTVIDSGDGAAEVLATYGQAQQQQDIIVGPLTRSAVGAVAGSGLVQKPTIALNHPEGRASVALPPAMLVIGLSIEDEARDVASWAGAEQPAGNALVLSTGGAWQRRIADAFNAQWQSMGRQGQLVEMTALNGYLSDAELVQLRARLQNDAPALLFAAMDADQVRQLKVALGPLGATLPVYGTSSLNPGSGRGLAGPELDGVRLLDLPWQVQRDHPAVMVYPQPLSTEQRKLNADMERLYALGIDAFRVAREIGMQRAAQAGAPAPASFLLDGVTGKLTVGFGQGAATFERSEQQAVYQNGSVLPWPLAAPPPVPDTAPDAGLPAPAPAVVRP